MAVSQERPVSTTSAPASSAFAKGSVPIWPTMRTLSITASSVSSGMSAIGVIFFGLIGSQATISADTVRPELSAALTKAGIPDFVQPTVISSFETCFHDRSNAKDFSVEPESCRQARESAAAGGRC